MMLFVDYKVDVNSCLWDLLKLTINNSSFPFSSTHTPTLILLSELTINHTNKTQQPANNPAFPNMKSTTSYLISILAALVAAAPVQQRSVLVADARDIQQRTPTPVVDQFYQDLKEVLDELIGETKRSVPSSYDRRSDDTSSNTETPTNGIQERAPTPQVFDFVGSLVKQIDQLLSRSEIPSSRSRRSDATTSTTQTSPEDGN
jgi:hypothetical protein